MAITKDQVIQFLKRFDELALKEDFGLIKDMIHANAFFRLHDGDHVGRGSIRGMLEKSWRGSSGLKRERYFLSEIEVLTIDDKSATATFTYNWEGSMGKQTFSAQGRGTRVMVVEDDQMQIIHEHLSQFPQTQPLASETRRHQ